MYRVAVCDDEGDSLTLIERAARRILKELQADSIIDTYSSIEALYQAVRHGAEYHLLLLDILFDGPNGLELARTLRDLGQESSIIMISKCADYVFAGYEVQAVAYLMKPLDQDRLRQAMTYAYEREYQGGDKLILQRKSERVVLPQKSILYCEAARHTVFLCLDDQRRLQWGISLNELLPQLSKKRFMRCHKGYVVNLARVQSVKRYSAQFFSGEEIPIGRQYFQSVQNGFLDYHTSID